MATPTELTKQSSLGEWISIAPEVRPGHAKKSDDSIKPIYLKRLFRYFRDDKFEFEMIDSADAYGKIPLVKIVIKGHMIWQGEHPIAAGAQNVAVVHDEAYEVTPLDQGYADVLNQAASKGFNEWQVNVTQSILGKAFSPFGLIENQSFAEYDLIYIFNDMMFWGARHFDGRRFDKPENRPTNLQIPLVRKVKSPAF